MWCVCLKEIFQIRYYVQELLVYFVFQYLKKTKAFEHLPALNSRLNVICYCNLSFSTYHCIKIKLNWEILRRVRILRTKPHTQVKDEYVKNKNSFADRLN